MNKKQSYIPFNNIEDLTIYKNSKYYNFIDGFHIKEIFSVGNDILCVFYLNNYKNSIRDMDYLDLLETKKITINNLNYNTELSYITLNIKSDELFVYYDVKEENNG